MKAQSNFRIKHHESSSEYGKFQTEYYYIQELKKFLWWSYWKDVKHTEGGWGGSYKTPTTFETLTNAQLFVKEVLCPEIPKDIVKEKVVDEISCK